MRTAISSISGKLEAHSATNHRLVSVVIPTYNMARFLPESIESVLAQTYRELEVIVVDDESTDDTRRIVNGWMQRDERVRYHHKKNGGEAKTRNAGVRLCEGYFIAFNDADDVWYPQKLEKQMALFEKDPSPDIVYSDKDLIDEYGNALDSGYYMQMHSGTNLYPELLIENFVPMSSPVMRRNVFNKVGLFDEEIGFRTDHEFWLRASVACRFDFIAEPLEAHRKWSLQMTKNRLGFAEAHFRVLEKFTNANPELLDPKLLATTLSAAHLGRGAALSAMGNHWRALPDLLTAMWYRPKDTRIIKSIIKAVIRRKTA